MSITLSRTERNGFSKDIPKQKLVLENLIKSNASPLTAIHAAYTYRVNVHRLGQLENSQIAKKDMDDSDRKYELAMQVFVPIESRWITAKSYEFRYRS